MVEVCDLASGFDDDDVTARAASDADGWVPRLGQGHAVGAH